MHPRHSWRATERMAARAAGMLALAVFLAGCTLGGAPPTVSTTANGIILINGDQATPPPFPVFTIGAWISDMSPQKGDDDHLYVLARIHDPNMVNAPTPAQGVSITAYIDNSQVTHQTDSAGYAVFDFPANGTPTQPDVVNVTASYQGQIYQTDTFYTVLPVITPQATPTGGPTATPTTGP
jgi:hypothetical protein